MTLLTISPELWYWLHFVGPALNIIPALLAAWCCSSMDLKKWATAPIVAIVYVGFCLVLHFGLQAISAAGLIVVSGTAA